MFKINAFVKISIIGMLAYCVYATYNNKKTENQWINLLTQNQKNFENFNNGVNFYKED